MGGGYRHIPPVNPLPWHDAVWTQLRQRRLADALPHAWLCSGPAGVGKTQFVLGVAQALLCAETTPDGRGCGHCPSCQWVMQDTHPDITWARPEELGKEILIDTVRALTERLTHTSSGYKLALIQPAERLTPAAANGLLKTLEEPPPNSLLFLISDRPAWLPATVRSRCVPLHLPLPAPEIAQNWLHTALPAEAAPDADLLLSLSGGAPLRALALAEHKPWLARRLALWQQMHAVRTGRSDPLLAAAAWHELPLPLALEWLQRGLLDLLRLSLTGPEAPLSNPDIAQELQALAALVSPDWLAAYLGDVQRASKWGQSALTPLLLLEELLIAWRHSGRLAGFERGLTL